MSTALPLRYAQETRHDELGENLFFYDADPGLVDAANVALLLGRPLLLTGKPGTGKTTFAESLKNQIERQLAPNKIPVFLERFNTRSTSIATELFYEHDALRRYHDRQFQGMNSMDKGANAALPYLRFSSLGQAIIRAADRRDVKKVFNLDQEDSPAVLAPIVPLNHPNYEAITSAQQALSVVLIDEVDKAPRDFPNDILNVMEDYEFSIPELSQVECNRLRADPFYRPIIVFTSNSEKNLPDAFLRRCIYYDIPIPQQKRLEGIVFGKFPELRGAAWTEPALKFFEHARIAGNFRKELSTAELLDWLRAMRMRTEKPDLAVDGRETLAALVKAHDSALVAKFFDEWMANQQQGESLSG